LTVHTHLGAEEKKWLKIKTVLETLDLVITAAEYGYGSGKVGYLITIWQQKILRQVNF